MQFFNKLRSNLFILAFNDKIVMNAGAWRLQAGLRSQSLAPLRE